MDVDAPPPEPHDPAATSDAGGGGRIRCGAEEVGGMNFSHDGTEGMLLSFCRKYGVGEDYKPLLAEDGWEPWKTMPEGSKIICVFDSMLKVGVQFPLHDFYVDYLLHYGIAPSQLTPNAWRYLVGFVKLCNAVGVPPTVAVFQCYFHFKMCSNSGKRWYYIVPSPSRRLFKPDANLPSNDGWKKRFFFLKSTSVPWRCPEKWGTPEPASFAEPELTDAEKKATERLESWKEKNDVSLMELLHDAEPDADDAARMPPPKKKYRSLGAITSPPSEQLATIAKESSPTSDDGNEHCSALRILTDSYKSTYKSVQRTEEELQNAKGELQEERIKHAADVAQMEEVLGAAKAEHAADVAQLKEKLQAAEAEHAETLEVLGQVRAESKMLRENHLQAAAAKEREAADAKLRQLMNELQEEKAKGLAKFHQCNEDLRAAKAEHEAEVLQLGKELQAERAERAAEVKATRADCQRKVIQEKRTRSAEMNEMLRKKYDEGWKDMTDYVVVLYPSIDPALLTSEAVAEGSVPPGFPPHQAP